MASIHAETEISRSPDEVWKVVGDFDGLPAWAPGIQKSVREGNRRRLTMGTMEVVEEELSRDDGAHTYSYGLVDSPGVEKHVVTVRAVPAGQGTRVTLDCECEPDSLGALFEPTYTSFVQALKAHLES